MINEIFVTTNDETQGRSTKAPTRTLPSVFETPMREIMKEAESAWIPLCVVMLGRYTYGTYTAKNPEKIIKNMYVLLWPTIGIFFSYFTVLIFYVTHQIHYKYKSKQTMDSKEYSDSSFL